MITAGLDVGAITVKAAIIEGDVLRGAAVARAGFDRAAAAADALARALAQAGLVRAQVTRLVGTGYGRVQLSDVDRTVTEITCHARGAHFLCPQARTVIDVGGQDSKAISLGPGGRVLDFVMNDKCAAGSGRFLEVMAQALEVELEGFGELALSAPQRAPISSTCAVFAESEVITLIAQGRPKAEIAAGVHEAIAARIAALAGRIAVRDAVVLTGGVARNVGVARMLEEKLGRAILTPQLAQLAGAIGAALIGAATEPGERS